MEDEEEFTVGRCLLCGGRLLWHFDWGWHTHCDDCGVSIKQIYTLLLLALVITLYPPSVSDSKEFEKPILAAVA